MTTLYHTTVAQYQPSTRHDLYKFLLQMDTGKAKDDEESSSEEDSSEEEEEKTSKTKKQKAKGVTYMCTCTVKGILITF